jgi:hypothetical protein
MFVLWIVVTAAGVVIGRQLGDPMTKTLYTIAGAAIGWFGLAPTLRGVLMIHAARLRSNEPRISRESVSSTELPDYLDPGWPIGAALSDAIRDRLREHGIELLDSKPGTHWVRR